MRSSTVLLLLIGNLSGAPKFYPDDPIEREPPPLRVEKAKARKISDIYDLFSHIFATPGEKQVPGRVIPAMNANTAGETPDGPWYQMRHARRRMSLEDLVRGPGAGQPPSTEGTWTIISAKSEGVTPGFMVEDVQKRRYFIKFDPMTNPEMTTAADVISSKFFHAFGYNVPENYIVPLDPERLEVRPKATFVDGRGMRRPLLKRDVSAILMKVPRMEGGRIRAVASRLIPGEILREFRWYGTREDDPNDTVPHEHRRELRGAHVFCAWLGHEDSRAINTLDSLVEENGLRYVKHYLIDFGSTLGSASTKPNSPRSGWEQFFTWRSAAREFFTFGLYTPGWSRVDYPDFPSVGRFTAEYFDPKEWTPEYPNPAFDNRLPDDTFWAARQVMAFTDDEIRAVVKTGMLSNPAAERYVADTLIARRNLIGRAYLSRPGTLDRVRIENESIAFDDLAVRHGFASGPPYSYEWFSFDNAKQSRNPIAGAATSSLPTDAKGYFGVTIRAGAGSPATTVYLRKSSGVRVAGIERDWN